MDSQLTIRNFIDADAGPLTAVLHAAYADLGARGWNYTAVDQDVSITLERARGGQCWIIERGRVMVASLTMSMPPSTGLQELTAAARVPQHAWLNQVAVLPTEQRRGIATRLWRRGLNWALSHGATSIGVDTAIRAEHLVSLYEGWGFKQIEVIHWPGKTYDSAVMIRPLDPAAAE